MIFSVMKEKEFEPDESETLLAAFKVSFSLFKVFSSRPSKLLDTENKGFIEVEMMKAFMMKEGLET